jgi:hypothetical protein
MRFSDGNRAFLVLLLAASACASETPQAKRSGPVKTSTGSAGAAASGTPDNNTPNPPDLTVTDNPVDLVTPTPNANAAGGGGAGGAGNLTADGCEIGKFCAPQEPDPTDCGKLELKTDVKTVDKPGNVLVVFDRSGSMEADWNGAPKYQAAGDALLSAITPLKGLLTIGGIFFPSTPAGDADVNCPAGCNVADPIHWIPGPGACCLNGVAGSCNVNTIDQPDELKFSTADDFITGLPLQWHLNGANGTPLEAGVARAAEAIKAQTFTDPLIVIVMTDGEPNCNTNATNVLNQITEWKTAGIPTHVIGLPGAQGAADLLNMMAQMGGTDKYLDPADPQELEMRLRTVISSTVRTGFDSCSFHLDPKAEVPAKLHMIVKQNGQESDVARDLSKDAHWKINDAGDLVELEGQLCDMAKDGTFESIRFVFGCVDTPPLEPPPPPMLN